MGRRVYFVDSSYEALQKPILDKFPFINFQQVRVEPDAQISQSRSVHHIAVHGENIME